MKNWLNRSLALLMGSLETPIGITGIEIEGIIKRTSNLHRIRDILLPRLPSWLVVPNPLKFTL